MRKQLSIALLVGGLLGLVPAAAAEASPAKPDHYQCWYRCKERKGHYSRYRYYRKSCWYHDRFGWYYGPCHPHSKRGW